MKCNLLYDLMNQSNIICLILDLLLSPGIEKIVIQCSIHIIPRLQKIKLQTVLSIFMYTPEYHLEDLEQLLIHYQSLTLWLVERSILCHLSGPYH